MTEDFVRNVDTLATELSESGEIDTSVDTSPKTVLTPSSGKRIDIRSVYLSTNSTAGEVEIKFPTSNKLLGKIYASKFAMVALDSIRITGGVDEPVQVSWSGLDTGAKIFYVIRYKEV